MFAGQMACEALNFVLKRLIREDRPTRKDFLYAYYSVLMLPYRDAWQGLRDAFLALTVCGIFLGFAEPMAALPACANDR